VTEKPIESGDITTFSEVCDANVSSASDSIIKCIYLRRRFEVDGAKGLEYDLLSSLLHLRELPSRRSDEGDQVALLEAEVSEATAMVKEYIADFDYAELLSQLRRPGSLKARFEGTDVGYEKVQLFRVMSVLDPVALKGDDVFTKFVNETYHIENEYVMQLNPREFDTVPEFVIAACTDLMGQTAGA